MEKYIKMVILFILCFSASVIFTGCVTEQTGTAKLSEEVKLAAELPIADVHMHAYQWVSPTKARGRMDKNGVRWAGFGVIGEDPFEILENYQQDLGDRFIPWAGQSTLNYIYGRWQGKRFVKNKNGIEATEDVNNPIIQRLLKEGEKLLKTGRIKGFGEIFVNNRTTNAIQNFRRKFRADAPSMRALYKLIAEYNGFLAFHMEPDKDSIAQLERLLSSDRKGRIIWCHAGCYTREKTVRNLLSMHPNLYTDLSFRYPPVLTEGYVRREPNVRIFGWGKPDSGWLKLIEDFPDRFMIGTDTSNRGEYDGSIKTVRKSLLPYLSPATARKVAYENAQRVFALN